MIVVTTFLKTYMIKINNLPPRIITEPVILALPLRQDESELTVAVQEKLYSPLVFKIASVLLVQLPLSIKADPALKTEPVFINGDTHSVVTFTGISTDWGSSIVQVSVKGNPTNAKLGPETSTLVGVGTERECKQI